MVLVDMVGTAPDRSLFTAFQTHFDDADRFFNIFINLNHICFYTIVIYF
jgi:hypothetical protein